MFFFSCDIIHTLWSELSLHIYRKTSKRIGFNVLNIMFGEAPLTCHNKVIIFFYSIYETILIFLSDVEQGANTDWFSRSFKDKI